VRVITIGREKAVGGKFKEFIGYKLTRYRFA
jgi:hypothetical protein